MPLGRLFTGFGVYEGPSLRKYAEVVEGMLECNRLFERAICPSPLPLGVKWTVALLPTISGDGQNAED